VIRRHLQTHRTHHEQRLALWRSYREAVEKRTHRQLVRRLAMRARKDHELIVRLKLLALDGNIRRAELEIAWVDDALAWLDAQGKSMAKSAG
jgi:hypothetical protein